MKTPKLNYTPTGYNINQSTVAETLEQQVERMIQNKEPIKEGTPLIYTEREQGVGPQYDIRTDRFEIAVEAMDKVTASHAAKRTMYAVKDNPSNDGGPEPIQASPTGTGEA